MKKRILSVLMSLALVTGLMAGCTPAASDSGSSDASGSTVAELTPVAK